MKGHRGGFNYDFAAAVLIAAVYTSDADACSKYGVTTRTLQNYRKRLISDRLLSECFATRKAKLDDAWVEDFIGPLKQGAEVIASCFKEMKQNPKAFQNPMLIDAVSNALRTIADIVLTNKAINAQFGDPDQSESQLPQEVPPATVEYPC